MTVTVNGQQRTLPDGMTVLQLIEDHKVSAHKVAVEFNRRLIKTEEYATVLKDGDEIEIVTFVGGG